MTMPSVFMIVILALIISKNDNNVVAKNQLQCPNLFGQEFDSSILNSVKTPEHRFRLKAAGDAHLPMDCTAIRKRHHFQSGRRLTETERRFPMAFAWNVFRDYRQLEAEIATHYLPSNFYCFMVDQNASPTFKHQIHAFVKCFPNNTMIAKKEVSMDHQGRGINRGQLLCLKELAKPQFKWRYVHMLENHDVQMKTNPEIVELLSLLNGANAVEVLHGNKRWGLNYAQDWTIGHLDLIKNPKKAKKLKNKRLYLAKGSSENSLTRESVDFILQELNLDKLIDQFDVSHDSRGVLLIGVSEYLWATLIVNAKRLGLPGGFTYKGFPRHSVSPTITRFTTWGDQGCQSRHTRHGICLPGIEDLPALAQRPNLFVNKMLTAFDYAAIHCWHRYLRAKTKEERRNPGTLQRYLRPFKGLYTDLPIVRWQNKQNRNKQFDFGKNLASIKVAFYSPNNPTMDEFDGSDCC